MEMKEVKSNTDHRWRWGELQNSRNKVIKGALKQNPNYFEPQIRKSSKNLGLIQKGPDNAFVKLIVDDPDAETPFDSIKKYIVEARGDMDQETLKDLATDFKCLVCSLIEESVETENLESLRKCIYWFDNMVIETPEMRHLTQHWGNFDLKTNNNSMIRACEKNNFEMVLCFLQAEFILKKNNESNCHHESTGISDLICRQYRKQGTDLLGCFRIFQATTKPAYLIAKFHHKMELKMTADFDVYTNNSLINNIKYSREDFKDEDPISEAFRNIENARQLMNTNFEYKSRFEDIIDENTKFTAQMLDLCKNCEESERVLANDMSSDLTSIVPYPRIDLAIRTKNIKFVAHEFCQEVLRKRMVKCELTGNIIPWNSTNFFDRCLYIMLCLVSLPFCIVCRLVLDMTPCCRSNERQADVERQNDEGQLKKEKLNDKVKKDTEEHEVEKYFMVERFFSLPINRLIFHSASITIFLGLLITLIFFYPDNQKLAWIVFTYTLSFIALDLTSVLRKNYILDSLYGFTIDALLLSGTILKFFRWYQHEDPSKDENIDVMIQTKNSTNTTSSSLSSATEDQAQTLAHYINLGEIELCLVSLALVLSIMKMLYFLQQSQWLGPLAISIRRVFTDLAVVGMAYIISLVAFTVGLFFIMDIHKNEECKDHEFHLWRTAFKTTFWSLFDPGSLGDKDFGCTDGFAKGTARVWWGVYQALNMLVLIPLLVALMSNTMAFMDKDKDDHWKYKRASIWLRYIDNSFLPTPFNLVDINFFKTISGQKNERITPNKDETGE